MICSYPFPFHTFCLQVNKEKLNLTTKHTSTVINKSEKALTQHGRLS